jgi:hypothetical protein
MAGFFVRNNHAVLRGVTTTNLKVNMFFNNKSEFAATLSDQFRTSSNWRKAQAKRYTHDTRNGEAAQRLLELESQIVIPDNVWEKLAPLVSDSACLAAISAAAPGYWRRHVHKESARNTGSPKAWSAMTNRKPVRDRLGALRWRRGS